jgi:tyrosinase
VQLGARIQQLAPAHAAVGVAATMTPGKTVELVGASKKNLLVRGAQTRTAVPLDTAMRNKVTDSLAFTSEERAPDRIFLNLENVRGLNDAVAFYVYVGLPKGARPEDHPNNMVGSIALFGVSKASMPTEEHGGQGLTFVLEITRVIDELHLTNTLNIDSIDVLLVPVKPITKTSQFSIGRVSVFRQGD